MDTHVLLGEEMDVVVDDLPCGIFLVFEFFDHVLRDARVIGGSTDDFQAIYSEGQSSRVERPSSATYPSVDVDPYAARA